MKVIFGVVLPLVLLHSILRFISTNACRNCSSLSIKKTHVRQNNLLVGPYALSLCEKNTRMAQKLKIEFVPQNDNPPNVPQGRPIERFWVIYYITILMAISICKNIYLGFFWIVVMPYSVVYR